MELPRNYRGIIFLPWCYNTATRSSQPPTWSASQRHVMICYKSDSKHYTIAIPTALHTLRMSDCCYNPLERPPITNFYKKPSSKNPLAASHDRFYWENIFIAKTEISEEQQQMPICIEIPIVMDYDKWHAFFGDFSSLQDPRNVSIHSPRPPATKNTIVT